MTKTQAHKISELMAKYNDILLVSMRLAIAEDFTNLVILNRDDTDFELSELIHDKEVFSNYVIREFLKQNGSSVVKDLRSMNDDLVEIRKGISFSTFSRAERESTTFEDEL